MDVVLFFYQRNIKENYVFRVTGVLNSVELIQTVTTLPFTIALQNIPPAISI